MRIASLLPAATEILYALGAGDEIVAVTHECDFPAEATRKPSLIRPRIDPLAPPVEVDRCVSDLASRGESLYVVDTDLFATLAPDMIVTQDLCHVCAASPETLAAALARLPPGKTPRVITFTPHTLADIWQGIIDIGDAVGRGSQAREFVAQLESKVSAVQSAVAAEPPAAKRPRVLCLEWFDPPYVAGHWVPEMVRLAGGIDVLGCEAQSSIQVTWQQILKSQPDVILLMSCGYNLQRNQEAWASTSVPSGWEDLPAVKNDRVHAVDANSYFSRPGPRLAEGVNLLARLLHPSLVSGIAHFDSGSRAFARVRRQRVTASSL
jgi:iron complex transport system substrate-binding protein